LFCLASVDFFRDEGTSRNHTGAAVALKLAVEAAAVAFVANARADGIDKEEECICIAIEADFPDAEDMPAGFAFFPELLARAREKVDFTRALSGGQRFTVQVPKHQDFASALILDDARNESIEFFECQIHTGLQNKKTR